MDQNIDNFHEKDMYAKYLGIEFTHVGIGTAKAKLIINKNHLNSMETVHGGAIFSLADAVFATASNSREGLAMAINVSISYFKAVNEGTLYAEAEEISVNKKLATYLIHIKNNNGKKIALFQGTVYRR